METQITKNTLGALFNQDNVKMRFEEMLGKKANGFISSVIQTVNNNKLLKNADPNTVLTAAATAATLDLPINQNLGFAWIVPYKGQAQFQMGWKGYVQLALRTGQYEKINVIEVYESQFESFDVLTEDLVANFKMKPEGEVVGYAAYFQLVNGMKKTVYWSKEQVVKHAKKYSQAYGSKYSPWQDKDQFDAMAKKTVLKNMLAKWGILSVDMQTAQLSDQSVQVTEHDYQYPDNTIDIEAQNIDEEMERVKTFIDNCQSKAELQKLKKQVPSDKMEQYKELFEEKSNELK